MAHSATKLPACANCHYAFPSDRPNEFCPRCGQQNHEVNLSFGHIAEETLEGIFHFDGKVFRTAKLLLFRPGELTRRFVAGQRVPYVPPIRLYVFISFVFFFLLSLTSSSNDTEPPRGQPGPAKLGQQQKATRDLDSLRRVGMLPAALNKRLQFTSDSGGSRAKTPIVSFKYGQEDLPLAELRRLPQRPTTAQLDSVLRSKKQVPGFWSRLTLQRAIRFRDISREETTRLVLRGASILMFVLMPLAALLLKGVYFRQRRYYIGHLIFTIHVHCFAFLLFLVQQLLDLLPLLRGTKGWLTWLLPLYFVVALHTFYQQSWGKTLGKTLLLGLAYSFILMLSLMVVSVIGFAIF